MKTLLVMLFPGGYNSPSPHEAGFISSAAWMLKT